MELERLEVLITANNDQFKKAFSEVDEKLGKLAKVSEGSSAVAQKSMKGMSAGMVAVGVVVSKVAIEIGKQFVKLGKDSVRFAMEAVESESLVATVFGDSLEEIVAWSDEVSNKLGLNVYEVRKNAGVFYNIAEAMGVSQKNAMSLSKGIVSLSNDMASFYNISTEEAVNKLRAGLTGQVVPLQQLGIVVNETTIKETAWRTGMVKTGEELTNNQKVLARYMTILDQTGTAHGDMARTLDSPANQLRVLQARWQQLATTLGNIFIPILNKVLPYIQALIGLLQRAISRIAQFFGIMGIKTVGTVDKISSGMAGLDDTVEGATNSVKALKKELLGLAGFDEMNVLKQGEAGGSGGGSVGGRGLEIELPDYDMGLSNVNDRATEIIEKIKGMFETLGEMFRNSPLGQLWSNIWEDITGSFKKWSPSILGNLSGLFGDIKKDYFDRYAGILGTVWTDFIEGLSNSWKKYGPGITDQIGQWFSNITAVFRKLWTDIFAPIITPFLDAFEKAWENTGKKAMGSIIDFVMKLQLAWGEIWNKVLFPVINWLIDTLSPVIKVVGERFGVTFRMILDIVGSVVSGVFGFLSGLIDFVVGMFTGDWKRAWQGLVDGFGSILNGIIGVGKAVINGWIGIVNSMISGLNKIKIPDWVPAMGGKGMNIQPIRPLATGGVVTAPTLAIMGEGGYKEAVLPLERNTDWAGQVADLINSKGGGANMNLVIKIGEDTIFEKAIDYMNDRSLMTGGAILNI